MFAANFFGARYVELMGRERLLESPAEEVGPVDGGVLVVVDADPEAWDRPERKHADQRMLDHLGREYFFAKPRPPDASRGAGLARVVPAPSSARPPPLPPGRRKVRSAR